MEMFFINLLFGHLVGDYLFQNKWMAIYKGENSFRCLIHCLVYTLIVCIFTGFNPYWIAVVFASHYPIDRYSLADKWLRLINGRTLKDFVYNGKKNVPKDIVFAGTDVWENYISLQGSFTAVVYTVTDNTMHLLIMYYGHSILEVLGCLK